MKSSLFQRSTLALAIAGGATVPMQAWSDSLLDGSSAVLTLREAPGNYQISGFDMVALPGGSFVVVWAEHDPSSADKLLLQLFDDSGQTIGAVRELGQSSTEAFEFPTVDADQNGNLAVAWTVSDTDLVNSTVCGGDQNTSGIRGRVIAPPYTSSNPLPVYSSMGDNPCGPEIAMDSDGDFVMVWADRNESNDFNISVQTYLAGGAPNRGQKDLLATSDPATVALQDDQRMLVGWRDSSSSIDSLTGRIIGFQLSTVVAGIDLDNGLFTSSGDSIYSASVAEDEQGGFLSSWIDSENYEIFVQRWTGNGTPVVNGFELDSLVASSVYIDSLMVDSDTEGNIIAVWNLTGDENSIVGSAVDKNGNVIAEGSIRLVSGMGAELTHGPNIAMNSDVVVVGWVPDSGNTINARIFEPLATESSSGSSSQDPALGAFNHFLMLSLVALLAVWRRFWLR